MSEGPEQLYNGRCSCAEVEQHLVSKELDEQQKPELDELLHESKDVLWSEQGGQLGQNTTMRQTPYRLPYTYQVVVKKEFVEMEGKGMIETSTSDWASREVASLDFNMDIVW